MVHPCDFGCASGYVNGINLPSVGGFEALGELINMGVNLKEKFYIGQKVHVCATKILGKWKFWKGVWCDYVILKKDEIIIIPEEVDNDKAMQLFVNVMTPLAMVKEMNLKKGDIIIQTAANSVVGRVMIQLSEIHGFKMINFVRNEEAAVDLIKKYNIKDVHVYSEERRGKQYLSLLNSLKNKNIKYVIDAVSGDLGLLTWRLLSRNGTFYSYGALSGYNFLEIDIVNDLCRKNKTLKGWSIQETWLKSKTDDFKLSMVKEIWHLFKTGPVSYTHLTLPTNREV